METGLELTERLFKDLLRELDRCPPWLTAQLIEGMMKERGYSQDAAIRELAEFEDMTRQIVEALERARAKDAKK